jgi:hypothetical protein
MYRSTFFRPPQWLEVTGQFEGHAALLLGKFPVATEQKPEWAAEPVWSFRDLVS